MARRIVVIGGSAAGMGAAGAAKQADPQAHVVVFTDQQDVAYSPCGIPYVHGKEIDTFDRLILQGREYYEELGYDIRYGTRVSSIDLRGRTVAVDGRAGESFDSLVIATGFEYERPDIPGTDLDGIYYVREIRDAMRWDEVLERTKVAVVVEAQPIGVEMATALAQGGIETALGTGRVRAVKTYAGEMPVDMVVMATKTLPNNRLAGETGITTGSTGGII